MSREMIEENGRIVYRTKAFADFEQATAFARCLSANSRFCSVEIETSGQGWRVVFQPSSLERQQAMHRRQLAAREERGRTEGTDYLFWPDGELRSAWNCFNPKSGQTYTVSPVSCTCPDYRARCSAAGLRCKHQAALSVEQSSGLTSGTDALSSLAAQTDVVTRSARSSEALRAWALTNRDLDF